MHAISESAHNTPYLSLHCFVFPEPRHPMLPLVYTCLASVSTPDAWLYKHVLNLCSSHVFVFNAVRVCRGVRTMHVCMLLAPTCIICPMLQVPQSELGMYFNFMHATVHGVAHSTHTGAMHHANVHTHANACFSAVPGSFKLVFGMPECWGVCLT